MGLCLAGRVASFRVAVLAVTVGGLRLGPDADMMTSGDVGGTGQNPPVPAGVPRPVGPSQPTAAVHRSLPQEAVAPMVTSFSEPVWP